MNWESQKTEEELSTWLLEYPCPCFPLSHLPHTQIVLCWSKSWSLRPVFQVVSFQWVTGMCVHAKENIKMFGECFRKIAQSRLPSLAYMVLFSSLFALYMCILEHSAVQLWLFLPQLFFLTAERIYNSAPIILSNK